MTCFAAHRTLVTVEEVVDRFEPRFNSMVLPGWVISGIVEVPRGAHPSYALGYDRRDNDFYRVVIRSPPHRDLTALVDDRRIVFRAAFLIQMLREADRREIVAIDDRFDLIADLEQKRERRA